MDLVNIDAEAAAQMDAYKMVQVVIDEDAESDSNDDETNEMTKSNLNEVVATAKAAAFSCIAAGDPFRQLETVFTGRLYTANKLHERHNVAKRATK